MAVASTQQRPPPLPLCPLLNLPPMALTLAFPFFPPRAAAARVSFLHAPLTPWPKEGEARRRRDLIHLTYYELATSCAASPASSAPLEPDLGARDATGHCFVLDAGRNFCDFFHYASSSPSTSSNLHSSETLGVSSRLKSPPFPLFLSKNRRSPRDATRCRPRHQPGAAMSIKDVSHAPWIFSPNTHSRFTTNLCTVRSPHALGAPPGSGRRCPETRPVAPQTKD